MSLKDRISSPLEAGTSILDAHHLPPHLTPALEYVSARLARRSLHVTLVVCRRDYHLPADVRLPSSRAAAPSMPATPSSPRTGRFNLGSRRVSAWKQLVRSASSARLRVARSDSVPPSASSPFASPLPIEEDYYNVPLFSSPPLQEIGAMRSRWPMSPATPLSPPPMTPCTASSTTTDTTSSMLASSFGMRLMQACDLSAGAKKTLRETLVRAEKAFGTGTEWLAPVIEPAPCGPTHQLVQSSLIQNEVLFASHGLTLLALDHIYCVKSALSSYSKTRSPLRLEDAVDELRRLVLARNGAKVTKADLFRSYDGLSVTDSALTDLHRMYCRAYGGPEHVGGISGMPNLLVSTLPDPVIRDDETEFSEDDDEYDEPHIPTEMIGLAVSTPDKPKPPSPRGPALKLQTSFDAPPRTDPADEEPDSGRTARPADFLPIMLPPGAGLSIDEVLSAGVLSPARSPAGLGPMTPNGYEDISPTTRGEWGFLLVDSAFQGTKTAAIETW